jgi:hypothetical protein
MQCMVATCNPVTHVPSLSQLPHKFPHTPSVHTKHYLNFTNYFLERCKQQHCIYVSETFHCNASPIKKLYIIFRLQNHNCSTEHMMRIWYQKTTILKTQVTQDVMVCNWVCSSNVMKAICSFIMPGSTHRHRNTAQMTWHSNTAVTGSNLNCNLCDWMCIPEVKNCDIFCYQDFKKCMLAMLEVNMAVRVIVHTANFWIKYYYIFNSSSPMYPEKASACFPNV